MKKHILLICLLCAGTLQALSQTIIVFDKTTLAPLDGADISSSQRGLLATTNFKGEAEIRPADENETFVIARSGYQTLVISWQEITRTNFRIGITEKETSLDEVVISASRFEEKRSDVPQQVELISSSDIRQMNQPTLADVVQNSGAVLVQKSQLGGGSPILRGFEANKVLIVIDGVRMNNAIFRGGHLQNILTLDNNTLDKAEILFGPGSVVYGSDALGGVMHFMTKRPILADSSSSGPLTRTTAYMRYSTAMQEKTGHADFMFGSKKFGSFTSLTFSDFDDLRQGNIRNPLYGDWGKRNFYAQRFGDVDSMITTDDVNLQRGTGYSQYDVLQKFLLRQNSRLSHLLNLQYSNSSDIPRYDRLTLLSSGKPRFAEWYYGPQTRLFASYTLEMEPEIKIMDEGRIILAAQRFTESRHDRRFGSAFRNNRTEMVQVFTLNADFEKRVGRHEFRYGAEGTFNKVASEAFKEDIIADTTGPLDTRYPNGGSTMASGAVYATHTWEISKAFILQDGLRFSHVSLRSDFGDTAFFSFPFSEVSQSNSAVNGNIGLVFSPGAGLRINAVASSGFRAPNVDDLGKVFESVPGQVVLPNPELGPEYTYNFELGVSKTFNQKITLSGSGYYTLYQNAITTLPGTYEGNDSILFEGVMSAVTMNQNAAEAYLYGAFASLSADVTPSFSIVSTVNYTYGRIRTDSTDYPLDHIPPVFGKTSFVLKRDQFRGEFYVMYNGWKRVEDYNMIGEDNFVYATPSGTPAWMTLNARASWQINRFVQVQAALENILDQNYRIFASGISAPGRNLILTLRGSF